MPALAARRRTWLIAAVSVGLILAVLLGGRGAWRLGHRLAGRPPPPRETDVTQIADWMSVPYVSRAYRVPENELYRALGIEPEGRWGGHLLLGRVGARVGLTPERVAAAEHRFERWGGLLVLATRCLLTGLALPTNLAAGGSGYPLGRFFGFAVVGEALWTGGYLGLGWVFGPNWVSLLDYLDDAVTVVTALAVVIGLGYALVRLLRPAPARVPHA